jgi:hypothetical protein
VAGRGSVRGQQGAHQEPPETAWGPLCDDGACTRPPEFDWLLPEFDWLASSSDDSPLESSSDDEILPDPFALDDEPVVVGDVE